MYTALEKFLVKKGLKKAADLVEEKPKEARKEEEEEAKK